jgi:phosphoribosyl 1,2-cyclic phosphodiesterase
MLIEDSTRAGVEAAGELAVLGSGSTGNCTVVRFEDSLRGEGRASVVLIDLGLSPKMTAARLASVGVSMSEVSAVLLTHLDNDHCNPGWCGEGASALPEGCEVFLPRSWARQAERMGVCAPAGGRLHAFGGYFRTRLGLGVLPTMQFHDALGAAAFRLTLPGFATGGANGAGTIGYATDLGRVTEQLVSHLRGVSVLAIESNYCPKMQVSSSRPEFLKRRIMGGKGHLSNGQCVQAVRAISPRDHVVLIHLSRECNTPEIAAGLHEGAGYGLTVSKPFEPTEWVGVRGCTAGAVRRSHEAAVKSAITTPGVVTVQRQEVPA